MIPVLVQNITVCVLLELEANVSEKSSTVECSDFLYKNKVYLSHLGEDNHHIVIKSGFRIIPEFWSDDKLRKIRKKFRKQITLGLPNFLGVVLLNRRFGLTLLSTLECTLQVYMSSHYKM